MRGSSSNHIKMILILVIGIVAGLVIFGIRPLISKISDTNAQIQKNKQELARIVYEIESYRGLLGELSWAFFEREALKQMFPVRERMVGLVENLEGAALQAGMSPKLSFLDVKESLEANRGGRSLTPKIMFADLRQIEEVPYTMELSGNYRQYVDFLSNFENLPFLSKITKLTLTADSLQNEKTKELENLGTGKGTVEGLLFIKVSND